jgi:hypothetical protein
MKVLCVIKKGRGGTSVSSAARYVSTRDRDEEREGNQARTLFSAGEDKLTASQANRFLGDGQEPNANDVLHVVISLEKEEDFFRLGNDEGARKAGVRETTRSAMKDMGDLLNADELRWVAGIHRNTDNPHVHLLIHRDYVDREAKREKRLAALQRELRLSWSSAPDGERITNPGALSQAFEKHLERNIERAREDRERADRKLRGDRLTLGRAMLAEDAVERLEEMRDTAIAMGEHRRYKIVDAQGRSRWLSEHDLRSRAEARADPALARLTPGWNPEVRRQLRSEAYSQEIKRYGPIIRKIRGMRGADLEWAEVKLQRSSEAARPLIENAKAIRREYESAGQVIPAPILSRAELAGLQDRAVLLGDAKRFRRLEEIRVSLAAEKGSPTRTESEIGRLRAQLFVVRSSLIAEQQALLGFEETKHLRRWLVDRNTEREQKPGSRIDNSLVAIEKALAWESDQAKFIGARRLHWDDGRREVAKERVYDLSEQRERVLQKIEDERSGLSSQIARKTEVVDALKEVFTREEARYREQSVEMPAPIFTEQEMKELAVHAERRRDPQFYRELIRLEREHDARMFDGFPFLFVERVSRAKAREVMSGIAAREAQSALQRFAEQSEQVTVIVKDDGARGVKLARMADVEPRTPLEQLLRPLIERSEKYREVAAAVQEYGNRLQQRYEQASGSYSVLKNEAREYEQAFVRQNPNRPMPRPQFSAWEISKLELHAMKENDLALRQYYETLYRDSLASTRGDSEARAAGATHKEYSRTIVLEGREEVSILDSASAGSFIDPDRGVGDRSEHFAERFDRNQAMRLER